MGYTRLLRSRIIDEQLGEVTSIGLLSSVESESSKAIELESPEYERQPITLASANGGVETTTVDRVEFPMSQRRWHIAGYGFYNSRGQMLYQVALPEPPDIPIHFRYELMPGDVRIVLQ
jgi:hypothetical protein